MVKRLSIFKKFDDSKNDKRIKNNKTIGPSSTVELHEHSICHPGLTSDTRG